MTDLQMCAFPPLGAPVKTVLTDRKYLTLIGGQMEPDEFDTLPAAWDRARELAEKNPDNPPRIYARFANGESVRIADWSNTY